MDKFIVENQKDIGQRLDKLAQSLSGLTRNRVANLISSGDILVNNKPSKAGYALRMGDKVAINLPQVKEAGVLPQNIPLDILFEDDHILIVNKAKGMVVHPSAGHEDGTLVNALLYHCRGSLSGIGGVMRPGIVHRIDKDTSGILVVAKSDAAHNGLAVQFANHSIDRQYVAIIHGRPKADKGTIDAPISRHKIHRKKMAMNPDGKRAVTHYEVLQTFPRHSLIQATLETGRTHQIRVHMAHIGHPVLGDPIYSNAKQNFGLEGQALHACFLGFEHPIDGKDMLFGTLKPPYFEEVLAKIKNTK
ncbi:MAG: RluA family pseudouridine synthase [Defluviitaleaceae bacterium]|nr:RluA family pseudouridine synthase [Defluviitaleaceae bacterium]